MRSRKLLTARRRLRRIVPAVMAGVVLALSIGACDSLLNVGSPSRIPADPLETPANADLLAHGAIADFDCAYGAFVHMGGMMTDELEDATLTAARWVYDQRAIRTSDAYGLNGCQDSPPGTYSPLQTARESADNVLRLLQGWTDAEVPDRGELIGEMATYAGYTRVLLGEMFCSSVISSIDAGGNITYGTELTPQQMFQSADSLFTLAIGTAGINDSVQTLAYLGRARSERDQGLLAQAAADAGQVPADFIYRSTSSTATPRRQNLLYEESNTQSVASAVGPRYQAMNDPRVKFQDLGSASNSHVEYVAQLKYPTASDPIPIGRYAEAQAIIAEADIAAGQIPQAVTIIDQFRARGGQGNYAGPMDSASVMNELLDQRSREFYLEGQRLEDVRLYNIQLLPATGSPYRNGGFYGPSGNQLCLPLPDAERQGNPNLNH